MGFIMLNGVQYTGNDGPCSYPPLIYSEAEREVGVWIDGRPLYQRTYKYDITTPLTTGATNLINIGTDKNILNITSSFLNKSSGTAWILPWAKVGSNGTSTNIHYTSDGYLEINVINDSWGTSYCLFITVQYTKNTDTPGSGKWTSLGGLAHHYSANEQVIGTWINGKPIYEKTITGSTISGGTTDYVAHNISNLDEVINSEIVAYDSSNGFSRKLNFAYNNGSTNDNWLGGYAISSSSIVFQIGTSFTGAITSWHATIQYTKTTD